MKCLLLCGVLAALVVLPASAQDPEPTQSPQIAAAIKRALKYESEVETLRKEYHAQLAKMNADYEAQVKELRGTLVKDLVELQSETAKQNLDDAAKILEAARGYEKTEIVSPYESEVAADDRVAVFLQGRPNSDIPQRIHILAANGRSLVINCEYPAKIGSGTWKLDGDQLTYTEISAARRYGRKEPDVTTVTAEWDSVRQTYRYPDAATKGLEFRTYVNGSGHLMFGNTDFLTPTAKPDRETESEEELPAE